MLKDYPNLRLKGLMTLAVHSPDEEAVRACFRALRECRDHALEAGFTSEQMGTLSMGMSGDLELAVEECATQIRVGSAIFGSR